MGAHRHLIKHTIGFFEGYANGSKWKPVHGGRTWRRWIRRGHNWWEETGHDGARRDTSNASHMHKMKQTVRKCNWPLRRVGT